MRGPLIVLLERDDFARELHTDSLVAQGYRVRAETQLEDALAALRKGAQLFIAGIGPGQVAVAELVAQIRRVSPVTPLMVILSRDAAEGPLRALRDGALEALTAPVSADALTLGAARCLETVGLFDKLPELRRHVELFLAAQRLMRAPDMHTLARELLDAATSRLPAVGVVISTAPPPERGGELIAARGLDDDDLRELVAAWDPEALERAEPLEAAEPGHEPSGFALGSVDRQGRAAALPRRRSESAGFTHPRAGPPPAPESQGTFVPGLSVDSGPRPRAPRKERFEDRVVTFAPGAGPFARVVGQTARLQPGLLALRIGPPGQERLWAMLFPPPRTRRETRAPDSHVATHLGMLAAQAQFALESAERFPDSGEGAIDPLTDLFDERYFTRTLDHEIQRHLRQGGPAVSVLVVDMEGLPEVVERHGMLIGERTLVEAARVLVRAVREVDLVARTGPHQFSVLLMGSNLAGAERSAERVRRTFSTRRFLAREGLDLRVPVAVGVAAHPQHGSSAPLLRDVAAQAARVAGHGP